MLDGGDIALIDITGGGLTFSDNVQPVCKPTSTPRIEDSETIIGFGFTETRTSENATFSRVLKKVSRILFSYLRAAR